MGGMHGFGPIEPEPNGSDRRPFATLASYRVSQVLPPAPCAWP